VRFVPMNRIKKVCLLPFWNAVVLGVIVGIYFLYVEIQTSSQGAYYDLESGYLDVPYAMQRLLAALIPTATIVFLVEIAIHGIVRWLRARHRTQ
jgi:hypothetical protein